MTSPSSDVPAAEQEEGTERFIGIDLGGTQLRAALIDASGRIYDKHKVKTAQDGGPAAVIRQICELIDAVGGPGVKAIGIGIPGSIEASDGTVLGIPALDGWDGIPLARLVQEHSGLPCVLENDATAAAIGEWRSGAGKGCDHFIYITISTGIGSGVIVDGHVLRGVRGLAGEIGHTKIADETDICDCGQIGCWQAIASGTALGNRAKKALAATEVTSIIPQLAEGAEVSSYHVGIAARKGDALAIALLKQEALALAQGFVNAQHLYAPERIVVGGGVSHLLDLMQSDIETMVKARLLPGFPHIPIVQSALGDDAGMTGAAFQAAAAT
jgi:glucokinase